MLGLQKHLCFFYRYFLQLSRLFFYPGFSSRGFTIHSTAGERGEAISLTPLYNLQMPHRYLDINRVVTAASSALHMTSSRTRTGNLWFPSASR